MKYAHHIDPNTGLNNLGHIPIWLDTKFTGLYRNTQLISIGLVTASGASFYAEFTDYDLKDIDVERDQWLQDNVLSGLLTPHATEFSTNITHSVSAIRRMNESSMVPHVYCIGDHKYIKGQLSKWMQEEFDRYTTNANSSIKFQFYCDCYAYDWMLFNNLFTENSIATRLPNYIYYIPFDLCTEMQTNGIDPDISREEFIGQNIMNSIKNHPTMKFGSNTVVKHNALIDTLVARMCTLKIQTMNHQ